MTDKHDKDKDGLDFVEMYIASGGRLQDLWIFIFYSKSFSLFMFLFLLLFYIYNNWIILSFSNKIQNKFTWNNSQQFNINSVNCNKK